MSDFLSKLKDLMGQREGLPVAREIETTRAFKNILGLPEYNANMGDLRVAEAQNKPTYADKPMTEEEVGQMIEGMMPIGSIGKVGNIAKQEALSLIKTKQAQKMAEMLKARLLPNEGLGNIFVKDVIEPLAKRFGSVEVKEAPKQVFGQVKSLIPHGPENLGKVIRKK